MEQNSKFDINKIFEKQINNFNLSWNSLNNDKKLLEQYSSFIQKFLDTINTYYMSLTELNASFPKSLFSSNDNIIDDSIKKVGNLLIIFIENLLNNLLKLLSNTQSILYSLNQTIDNSNIFLEKTQENNKNIFSNFKIINDQYNNEYLVMINSFENLENKIVEKYINNKYIKNGEVEYVGNNDIINNCLLISKKLENSFLNFKKDGIKKYIYEYNNNLDEIKNNRELFKKELKNCIINIINNFKEYLNNSINDIQNKISQLDSQNICNNLIENNDLNYRIKDNEINKIIYNICNSKKYNIKIIKDNEIINHNIEEQDKDKNNEEESIQKSKIILTEEDIYNIVKEIYNYDLISINKEDYNLEKEKEKLKFYDLLKKLLSYDIIQQINESISEDEIKTLYNLLNNNDEYITGFISILNNFLSENNSEIKKNVFEIINNLLMNSLDKISNKNNINIKLVSSIIFLTNNFYIIQDKEKYYLKEKIKNHNIFKSIEFWKEYTINEINEGLKKIEDDINIEDKSENIMTGKMKDIIFSKILDAIDIMIKFGVGKDKILKIIEPLIDKYQMDEKSKEILLSFINQII